MSACVPRLPLGLAGLGLLCLALPAPADLTLSGVSQVVNLNLAQRGQEVLYVKKDRLRRDVTERGRSYTYVYDAKQKELMRIDHLLRQVEVRRLSGENADPDAGKGLKLELSPTGRKQELGAWECQEHLVRASLPGRVGPEPVTVLLEGAVWLAPKPRELRVLDAFTRALPAHELFLTASVQGQAAPTQVQGVGEVLRRLLPKGMPCAFELAVNYEGGGAMANLARRMATRVSLTYDTLSTDALQDELFDPPVGYALSRP